MKLEIITIDKDDTVTRIYARKGFVISGFIFDIDEDNALHSDLVLDIKPTEVTSHYTTAMNNCVVTFKNTDWHTGA